MRREYNTTKFVGKYFASHVFHRCLFFFFRGTDRYNPWQLIIIARQIIGELFENRYKTVTSKASLTFMSLHRDIACTVSRAIDNSNRMYSTKYDWSHSVIKIGGAIECYHNGLFPRTIDFSNQSLILISKQTQAFISKL